VGCEKRTPSLVDNLPELPSELAETLTLSTSGTQLVGKPVRVNTPAPPIQNPHAAAKSSHAVTEYDVFAAYPLTICQDPTPASTMMARSAPVAAKAGKGNGPTEALPDRYFKLTPKRGAAVNPLEHDFFCHVHYGPWTAKVHEEESCLDGGPNRFTLNVVNVELVWYGAWEDVPQTPPLEVFLGTRVLRHVSYPCCSGFQWCSSANSCRAQNLPCPGPTL